MEPKPTFDISNLFTRILPGIITLAGFTVTEFIIKSTSNDFESVELTLNLDMLFSLDSLIVILLVALLLGEIVHLFSENIGYSPPYFREILYKKYRNPSMLSPLQRRRILKREASDNFESNKDATGVTLAQKTRFCWDRITRVSSFFACTSKSIRYVTSSIIYIVLKPIKYGWNLLSPNWFSSDEELIDITEDDLTEIFPILKDEYEELSDVTHPNRLYMALLYEMEDLESDRTKELRIRYQAFRNSKMIIHILVILIPITVLYSGIVGDNLELRFILSLFTLFFIYPIIMIIYQIGDITNVEQQYVQSLMVEYLIENKRNDE